MTGLQRHAVAALFGLTQGSSSVASKELMLSQGAIPALMAVLTPDAMALPETQGYALGVVKELGKQADGRNAIMSVEGAMAALKELADGSKGTWLGDQCSETYEFLRHGA